MIFRQLRRIFGMYGIVFALGGFLFNNILSSLFADYIYEHGLKWVPWLLAFTALVAILALAMRLRKPSDIVMRFIKTNTIRLKEEAIDLARSGFVGFVPLYSPQDGTSARGLTSDEKREAVANLDFDRLCVERSNLWPTIEAISTHAARLRHCWLISTIGKPGPDGRDVPGSLPYAEFLAQYLKKQRGMTCEFHYGPSYAVSLEDETLMCTKIYDLVRRIFSEADKLGISSGNIVGDITTGVRSMPLGMILASMGRERAIQFMGTHYDENGKPGGLLPMIFSFEPVFEEG